MNLKIALACDHAGVSTKLEIIEFLKTKGYEIKDFGTDSEKSCDYPDYAHPMAKAVEKGKFRCGISLCGSGNGINMVANKYPGIRSALCWNLEIARLARLHNDANICAIPARFITSNMAKNIVEIFLNTKFEKGRHKRRIDKIPIKKKS